MAARAVIHIDIDAFFAAVEMKKRPALKGRPVVIGGTGDPASRGVVSSASYPARAFGIVSGMPLKKALKLCPEAVFLPVDFESYERESERFMEILREYGPLVESFGLDEAFIEPATPAGHDPLEYAVKLAREIKARIKRELKLTASAGVGPNKLLAKMACDLGKPDGFFTIAAGDVDRLFNDMDARKLWGVGPKTGARLEALGIRTIGEISRVPVEHLQRQFGPVIGKTLHEHSRGIDDSPVVPFREPESMSREVTFETDTRDAQLIRQTLLGLTEDVAARLRAADSIAGVVTVKVRYGDFKTITHGEDLAERTDSFNDIWSLASKLFESAGVDRPVRLVGVKVSKLEGKGR